MRPFRKETRESRRLRESEELMEARAKVSGEEPALGVPYPYAGGGAAVAGYAQGPAPQPVFYMKQHPHQAGMIPPNAVFGDPKGIPLQQTMFRDTPAPFDCAYCGSTGLTTIRSKPSLAALVGCMMPFMLGVCFLCPSMDCLWHKYHYCPNCKEKVAKFEKSDPCLVVDPTNWTEPSYAIPRQISQSIEYGVKKMVVYSGPSFAPSAQSMIHVLVSMC